MKQTIDVNGIPVVVFSQKEEDYISLTDMIKAKDGNFFISDWLRNRNTIEFLSIWEKIHNPNFNYGECATIKNQSGLNSYKLSVKEWTDKTNAIGIKATAGRYGGTYAHPDIAFEFAAWISAEFKLYLIKEFQRLKVEEQEKKSLDWNLQRSLTKINYRIHTDAIKENLIPPLIGKHEQKFVYASEADVLNKALFGLTAQEFHDSNPEFKGNLRDNANVLQLVVLSNLENLNAQFISEGISQEDRLIRLNVIARKQLQLLHSNNSVKKLQEMKNNSIESGGE